MASTLVVEDGTIVAGANSYVSGSDAIAYAAARGVTLGDEAAVDIQAYKAMDYLATFNWLGSQVDPDTQELPWPRQDIYIDFEELAATPLPVNLVRAQIQLMIEVKAGTILLPTTSNQTKFVTKQKVGPIEREFSEAAFLAMSPRPSMPLIEALLAPYIIGGFSLRSRRV